MTTNINVQNSQVIPEQLKPALKAVDHVSEDIKEDEIKQEQQNTIRSIESAKTEESEEEALDNAVKQLNAHVQSINRSIEFNIDTESGKTVVKVVDVETDKLIRQIPNEEALKIAKQLDTGVDNESKEPHVLLIRAQA